MAVSGSVSVRRARTRVMVGLLCGVVALLVSGCGSYLDPDEGGRSSDPGTGAESTPQRACGLIDEDVLRDLIGDGAYDTDIHGPGPLSATDRERTRNQKFCTVSLPDSEREMILDIAIGKAIDPDELRRQLRQESDAIELCVLEYDGQDDELETNPDPGFGYADQCPTDGGERVGVELHVLAGDWLVRVDISPLPGDGNPTGRRLEAEKIALNVAGNIFYYDREPI